MPPPRDAPHQTSSKRKILIGLTPSRHPLLGVDRHLERRLAEWGGPAQPRSWSLAQDQSAVCTSLVWELSHCAASIGHLFIFRLERLAAPEAAQHHPADGTNRHEGGKAGPPACRRMSIAMAAKGANTGLSSTKTPIMENCASSLPPTALHTGFVDSRTRATQSEASSD